MVGAATIDQVGKIVGVETAGEKRFVWVKDPALREERASGGSDVTARRATSIYCADAPCVRSPALRIYGGACYVRRRELRRPALSGTLGQRCHPPMCPAGSR